VLTLHRNELHRRSESLFEDNQHAHSRSVSGIQRRAAPNLASKSNRWCSRTFAGGAGITEWRAAAPCSTLHIFAAGAHPHVADEAFAEALASFRGNLGGVEQLLRESADARYLRSLRIR